MSNLFPKLPNRKYQIIYADPPWYYDRKQFGKKEEMTEPLWKATTGAHSHYPTVKLNDLKRLDIRSIADEQCLLFI